MADLRVSLLGFGVVGQALARSLAEDAQGIRMVSVTDRGGTVADGRGLDPGALLADKKKRGTIALTASRDARWAIEHVESDVVVDLLHTDLRAGEPSFSLAEAALRRRKALVLAGKGALALHGPKLRLLAGATSGDVSFSAAICGGTPVLELVRGAFRGDKLLGFDAVLNGSTNFVLSRLEEGDTWESATAQARAQGILEADPSLDLLGLDAAAKAVILSNVAWRTSYTLDQVKTQGIVGITAAEAREAKANGLALRLVARASPEKGISVAPVALPRDHPLVTEGTENAVRLKFAGAGVVTLRGPGAGGRETAAAVLSDLLALKERAGARVAPLLVA